MKKKPTKKKSSKTLKPKRQTPPPAVEFLCPAPEAEAVFLTGSFNDWKPDTHPMQRDDGGVWRTSLIIPPGRYEFKFVVDGKWCCEPGGDGSPIDGSNCVANEFGTMNRVLEVGTSA